MKSLACLLGTLALSGAALADSSSSVYATSSCIAGVCSASISTSSSGNFTSETTSTTITSSSASAGGVVIASSGPTTTPAPTLTTTTITPISTTDVLAGLRNRLSDFKARLRVRLTEIGL